MSDVERAAAALYLDALRRDHPPTNAVAQGLKVSPASAGRLVKSAREHGLIPPAVVGTVPRLANRLSVPCTPEQLTAWLSGQAAEATIVARRGPKNRIELVALIGGESNDG